MGLLDKGYELYKKAIPIDTRFYLQSLLGDRTQPLTEKDLTTEELIKINKLIEDNSGTSNDIFGKVDGQTEEGMQYIDEYSRYYPPEEGSEEDINNSPRMIDRDLIEKNYGKTQTALGRFAYQKMPNGQIKIIDTYDFNNPEREHIVEYYDSLGPVEKAIMSGTRSLDSLLSPRGVMGAAGEMGMAYIGKDGRPVEITYDPEELKNKAPKSLL